MCGRDHDTINRIARESPKLAQKKYKRSHDWIERCIHWEICGANGTHVEPKWYEHQLEAVIENDLCKIFWDFTVQTDHFITAKRSDIIAIDKDYHECQITEKFSENFLRCEESC